MASQSRAAPIRSDEMSARLLPPLRSFLEAAQSCLHFLRRTVSGAECDFERYNRTVAAFMQLANASC
jgi:hypothetical protein